MTQSLPQLLLSEHFVRAYLAEQKLRGTATIEAVLLRIRGTAASGPGQPGVLFVVEVDGKKVTAEMSLNVLGAITSGLLAGAARTGWRWRE